MTNTYHRFLSKDLDLSPLGVERRPDAAAYFCTPRGASIIGWAGVDGIHYCFLRGFGEMVFAVSPLNTFPDYVHPLAKNFTDFLRLILACGDSAPLEQAWMWDKETFEDFIKRNPATSEQAKILAQIKETLKLSAMEQPWEYIHALQDSFDYSKIKYTEDFYDPEMNEAVERAFPQWNVYFDGNFWGHPEKAQLGKDRAGKDRVGQNQPRKDRAGKEIAVNKVFQWAGRQWTVPAVYSCTKGLVVDFCMRADPADIQAFLNKWNRTAEHEEPTAFSREQEMELELDNPLSFDFTPTAVLNGKELSTSHGCGFAYIPGLPKNTSDADKASWIVAHYDLDPAAGWMIRRSAFPWKTKRRPEIKSLSLILSQLPAVIPGPRFHVKGPGYQFSFTRPGDETEYILTVESYHRQALPPEAFPKDHREYPGHFWSMGYTVRPEIRDWRLEILDCAENDQPKQVSLDPFAPDMTSGIAMIGMVGGADGPTSIGMVCRVDGPASVGVIGGADGPTSVGVIGGADGPTMACFTTKKQGELSFACSSLHFLPAADAEWLLVFHEKQFDDTYVRLLPS